MTIRMQWVHVVAFGLAVGGCRTSAIYVPAVQMQVAVQPAEVRAGDTVRIAVTLVNPQADTVTLEFGEECGVSFMVLDETDRAVTPQGSGCLEPGGGRLVLPPGGTWRIRGAWPAVRADGETLTPGAYKVGAVLEEHASVIRGKREVKMGSGAERVPLRVLPARTGA